MSKHLGEKCGKLFISSILSSSSLKINDTRIRSETHKMKLLNKMSAQYVKACGEKLKKNCVNPVF